MISCRHYFFNDRSDQEHFLLSESVSTSKIAWGAARTNIASDVRLCVVDSIQSPWRIGRAAIGAWLTNNRQDFGGRHIALVNFLVRLTKIDGAAFFSSLVSKLARGFFYFLLGRRVSPSLIALAAHRASGLVALPALVRKAKKSSGITDEMLTSRRKRFLAFVTDSFSRFSNSVFSSHTVFYH